MPNSHTHDYERHFWTLVLILTVARLLYAFFPNLVPQEAYYWLYAKHLDLSYFDHPPMAAWTIAFFTWLGTDAAFFIRLSAISYSVATAMVVFYFAREFFQSDRLAFWAVVLMNSTVVFGIGAVIITPDSPMVLFWALVVYAVYKLVQTGHWGWWYAAGIALGFAFLSKYTSGLLVGCTLIFLLMAPRHRRWLRSIHLYAAILLAFIIFSPVIIWNMQHDWVSFAFQSTRRIENMSRIRLDYFFQLIGSQLGMLTPVIFIGLIYSLGHTLRQWWRDRDEQKLFLLVYSVLPLVLFVMVSLRSLVKMNWPAPAYFTGLVLLIDVTTERLKELPHVWKRWIRSGLAVGISFTVLFHLMPLFTFFPIGSGDTWSGWPEVTKLVQKRRAELKQPSFIFSPNYKISSELTYYLGQKELVHSCNIYGKPALQFDFWSHPDSLIGQDAVAVSSNSMNFKRDDWEMLENCFKKFETAVDTLEIVRNGIRVRTFYVMKCYNYTGINTVDIGHETAD